MISIKINKPIYATYIAIRDKYLDQAIRLKTHIRVEIPQGVYLVDPKKWIKTGRKQEKVFLIPGKPMVLYENHCERFPKEKQELEVSALSAMAQSEYVKTKDWSDLGRRLHEKIQRT